MPYEIKWEESGVILRYYGLVDAEDIIKANSNFLSDPRSDTVTYQINDYSNATRGIIERIDLDRISAMDIGATYSIPNLMVAFISIPGDKEAELLTQQYIDSVSSCHTGWKFKIFDDIYSARMWIFRQ